MELETAVRLDARQGDLTLRGFCKTPTPHGSSRYTLDGLSLHSAGLTLDLPDGALHFNRRTQTFTRGGHTVPVTEGRLYLCAALHAHETWIAAYHGPTCRESLVALHRPPRPVMGALEPWRAYLRGGGPAGSAGLSFQPPVPVVGWVPGMGAQISQVL